MWSVRERAWSVARIMKRASRSVWTVPIFPRTVTPHFANPALVIWKETAFPVLGIRFGQLRPRQMVGLQFVVRIGARMRIRVFCTLSIVWAIILSISVRQNTAKRPDLVIPPGILATNLLVMTVPVVTHLKVSRGTGMAFSIDLPEVSNCFPEEICMGSSHPVDRSNCFRWMSYLLLNMCVRVCAYVFICQLQIYGGILPESEFYVKN